MNPFEYVEADELIKPDTRTPAQKWLDAEMDKRWANEQGAEQYPILEAIALAVIEENQRLRAVEAAARNLVKVKGRYHTEQAFKALAALLVNTEAMRHAEKDER